MSEYLVVRLAEGSSSSASWIVLDASGHRVSQPAQGSLSDAAPATENRRVILLVPGLDVVSTRASLPVKSQSRLQQMLPFSLEDVVAEDVERLHFAAGPRDASGEMPVAIVSRELLEYWLEACAEAGISPAYIYTESEGVPDTPGSLTLIVEGDRTYGRGSDQVPFVLEGLALNELFDVLKRGDEDGDGDVRHIVLYADEAGHLRCEGELPALREQTSSIDLQLLPEGPLPRFGSTLISQPGSNLLQGAYAPKSNWGAMLKPWRLAASLLVAVGLLTVLGEGVRYLSLSLQDQSLSETLQVGCQRTFQSPLYNACRAEIQRRLASTTATTGTGGDRGFLPTLAAVAEARGGNSRIEALSFRNGVMDLRVMAPSVPALDELAREVGAGGRFQVNIQSANPSDDGVEGRLQVVGLP